MNENLSEDYQLLSVYKANPCMEMSRHASRFFFDKYRSLIEFYGNRYMHSVGLSSERELLHFLAVVRYKYIPQALKSFNPEKVERKEDYIFAKYFYQYVWHAERDFRTRALKKFALNRSVSRPESSDPEELFLEQLQKEREEKLLREAKKRLSPLQLQIFTLMEQGKKQSEIKIINPKTMKTYTKGYVSKEVAKIKKIIKTEE